MSDIKQLDYIYKEYKQQGIDNIYDVPFSDYVHFCMMQSFIRTVGRIDSNLHKLANDKKKVVKK